MDESRDEWTPPSDWTRRWVIAAVGVVLMLVAVVALLYMALMPSEQPVQSVVGAPPLQTPSS